MRGDVCVYTQACGDVRGHGAATSWSHSHELVTDLCNTRDRERYIDRERERLNVDLCNTPSRGHKLVTLRVLRADGVRGVRSARGGGDERDKKAAGTKERESCKTELNIHTLVYG